ncbi:ABC transporter ATP-binding protein/permease [Acetatifactor muris]|uniref:Putative ABC transporter ATP-binding protein n=1 Tax=Acetatifactor muris TaxID=879566 RepID=A0A2K4ZD45_9FIRM|nr:ABC transporter ATP-binding protein [Acetatifactor muris]MCR2046784.1 ABC transporter ATP-binding protein/permease [Acetatifactor muris]SOY28378.1 putative ABC transporter ATP-binding protein [Acetatifactor muris]
MLKIFKYLKESKWSVLAIIVLLIVQAYCDLALPQYTADIVDVGIGQKGIEGLVPEHMRESAFESLAMFLTGEEREQMASAYEQTEDGSYVFRGGQEEKEALNESMGLALLLVSMMESGGTGDIFGMSEFGGTVGISGMPGVGVAGGNAVAPEDNGMAATEAAEAPEGNVPAGGVMPELTGELTDAQILAVREQLLQSLGDTAETVAAQKAVLFIQQEYEQLGMDLGRIQRNYLYRTGGMMLVYSVVMMATAILVGLLAARIGAKLGLNLRERVFTKVVSFSHAEMEQFSTASLITRSTNDIQQVQMVVVMMLRMVVYAPIIGIGGVVKVLRTRTGMGWIIVVAVVLILALVGVLMAVAMPKFKKMQTLVDRMNLVSREILTGVPVIRAFSREKFEEARFDRANRDLMQTQLFTNRVMNVMMPVMMLIMNGISIMIVWFGAKGIDMGNLMVGDMLAFITYTMQIVMSFLMLTMISVMLPRAGVAAGRIEEVIGTQAGVRDKDQVQDDRLKSPEGVLAFEDVSFRYPGADEDALEHLTFMARPGETTAIIGSTGCGKSTLLNLIPRFYDVTAGRITIDGVDIRDVSQHKLRSLLGYVPQKAVLFSGDIASNLKFGGAWKEGIPDISDRQMREAAEIAQATEFIESKPDRYHSEISQGGTNVSGGQKQRLSIARAIAKAPKIFLFDDSFSALDYKTDVTLRKALREKTADATVIIVAQRISTILHADRIIVLDEGRIAGMGTHSELLRECGAYREIARSQLSEAELEGGASI